MEKYRHNKKGNYIVEIEYVTENEDITKINTNSVKRIMSAALQRHASHTLKENDLCSEEIEDMVSFDGSSILTNNQDAYQSISPIQDSSVL